MKIFQSIKDFFRPNKFDFTAFAICFALSCFIYYVYKAQNVKSNTFTVKVQILNNNEKFFVQSGPPSTEQIQINLEGDTAESLGVEDFKAYIDLSYVVKSGRHDFPVLLEYVSDRAKNDISLQAKCKPSHVTMEVDEVISDYIEIEPNIVGQPPKGFEVKSVTISPPYIFVTGPKAKVRGKKSVKTTPISIMNAKSSLKSDDLKIADNLLFSDVSDENISVEVEILPIKQIRTFDLIPVKLEHVDPKLEVSSQTDNISLDIYGSLADLDLFEITDDFIVANCSGIHSEGKYNVPVKINLPSRFSLANNSIKNITVVFNKKIVQVENITETTSETNNDSVEVVN